MSNPKMLAAELYDACARQEGGNPGRAARKAAYYLFQELIGRLGPKGKAGRRELLDCISRASGKKEIEILFELRRIGGHRARRVFQLFGDPLSKRRLQEIENMGIIDRLDMMQGGTNLKELARQIAHEKYSNPTLQQIETVERQIQKLNAKRNDNEYWPQREG